MNIELRVQNTKVSEVLAAPMYEENPNHLFPQVRILSNLNFNLVHFYLND